MSPPAIEALPHGIFAIDTGFHRPRFDAAYLMVERGRAAFIDTGTNHGVPRLLDALAAAGLAREAVDWLIVSHVHPKINPLSNNFCDESFGEIIHIP